MGRINTYRRAVTTHANPHRRTLRCARAAVRADVSTAPSPGAAAEPRPREPASDPARVYDFAETITDGLYRPQGQPFVTHLVRTASITLAEQQPTPAVLAAMAHSSYELHRFAGSRRGPVSRRRRAEVATAVGDDVEAMIWAYHATRWRIAELDDHVRAADTYDERTRQVLVMRMANELEDLLDLAPLLSRAERPPVGAVAAVARKLGHDQLAAEIEEAESASATTALPEGLARDPRPQLRASQAPSVGAHPMGHARRVGAPPARAGSTGGAGHVPAQPLVPHR